MALAWALKPRPGRGLVVGWAIIALRRATVSLRPAAHFTAAQMRTGLAQRIAVAVALQAEQFSRAECATPGMAKVCGSRDAHFGLLTNVPRPGTV